MSMVEWKKLGEVCSLKARIGWQGLTQKEHKTTGEYLLVTGTDFTANYEVDFDHCVYVDEERYTQDPNIQLRQNDVLITKDGTLGKMAVIEKLPKPATLNGGLFVIRDLTGKIHHKYLLHYMLSSKFQSIIESNHTNGTIKHLTQALLTNFPIPIPALDKQIEIVRILDTFTSSIDNLKQQIAQRRKQYEYYRDQLLDLEGKEGVEMKALGEIGVFIRGNGIQKSDFVEEGFGCIHYGQIHARYGFSAEETISKIEESLYKKCKKAQKGDVVLATTSEDAEGVAKPFVWLGDEKIAVSGDAFIYHHNQNGKFMGYQFLTHKFMQFKVKNATGAKVVRISGDNMAKYVVALPTIEKQNEIVDILDKFEASIQNLEAQLSQRVKQYEYFRNKLLTFE